MTTNGSIETYDEENDEWKVITKNLNIYREGHTTFTVTDSFCN